MNQKIVKYSKNTIRLLCQSLDNGNIIAVPTDTVYGLVADAHNENAVNKIFKAKLRPKKLPLIIFLEQKKIGLSSAASALGFTDPRATENRTKMTDALKLVSFIITSETN